MVSTIAVRSHTKAYGFGIWLWNMALSYGFVIFQSPSGRSDEFPHSERNVYLYEFFFLIYYIFFFSLCSSAYIGFVFFFVWLFPTKNMIAKKLLFWDISNVRELFYLTTFNNNIIIKNITLFFNNDIIIKNIFFFMFHAENPTRNNKRARHRKIHPHPEKTNCNVETERATQKLCKPITWCIKKTERNA